jgi:O-antigen/teichoic acid export membrane protein
MNAVRTAVILMTLQRYLVMVMNFATLAVVSRLLRPDEIGVAVVGSSVAVIVMAVREYATTGYLVQKKDLTDHDVRAAFSVLALVTGVAAAGLALAAPWVAAVYGKPLLQTYLQVVALAALLEAAAMPILSLLQREMAFRKVAIITSFQVFTGSLGTIALAFMGAGAMSYAWGWLSGAACSTVLAFTFWRDFSVFRPVLRGWRAMLVFGGYSGTNQVLYRIYEMGPSLVLGRFVSMDAVGLYNRSMAICQLPDKVFLSGVVAVSVAAFSAKAREEHCLKEPYLRAMSYVTALQWPALLVLALLAYPIVQLLLGSQWTAAAPVIQILALAWAISFSFEINYPVLVALGRMRDVFLRGLIAWPVSAAILAAGAAFSLHAMAFSFFLALAFQAVLSLRIVRERLSLSWRDFFGALGKSAVVTAFAGAGPLAVIALAGFNFQLSIMEGVAAGAVAGLGWLTGIWLTDHPLRQEIVSILAILWARSGIGDWLLRGRRA